MVILDQVPITYLDNIEITVEEHSKGNHEESNGEIKWDFELNSGSSNEFDLIYTIKYPKNKTLQIQ